MREIVFDTETTGLNCEQERIVEIGCVELINKKPTGRQFHYYINPEKPIDPGATRVHGITDEKVKDAPTFSQIAGEFLAFIEGARLIAHNVDFDKGFLNAELKRLGHPPIEDSLFFDTLNLARQQFPKAKNTLDALCQRFKIDLSKRTVHGALLDAQLLVDVYIELTGGVEMRLAFSDNKTQQKEKKIAEAIVPRPKTLPNRLCETTLETHRQFVTNTIKNPLWAHYIDLEKSN